MAGMCASCCVCRHNRAYPVVLPTRNISHSLSLGLAPDLKGLLHSPSKVLLHRRPTAAVRSRRTAQLSVDGDRYDSFSREFAKPINPRNHVTWVAGRTGFGYYSSGKKEGPVRPLQHPAQGCCPREIRRARATLPRCERRRPVYAPDCSSIKVSRSSKQVRSTGCAVSDGHRNSLNLLQIWMSDCIREVACII